MPDLLAADLSLFWPTHSASAPTGTCTTHTHTHTHTHTIVHLGTELPVIDHPCPSLVVLPQHSSLLLFRQGHIKVTPKWELHEAALELGACKWRERGRPVSMDNRLPYKCASVQSVLVERSHQSSIPDHPRAPTGQEACESTNLMNFQWFEMMRRLATLYRRLA